MKTHQTAGSEGFSLIEVMVAVTLVGLLSSMAVMQIGAARPGYLGDGAMRLVMGEFNKARESAVTQRRWIDVEFVGTNRLRVLRIDGPGVSTLLSEATFESGIEFVQLPAIADTPDAFGRGSAKYFGGTPVDKITFNSEGSLVDGAGAPINGTVFLAIPQTPMSYRAVTILGTTGRVRGYKWDGGKWARG